MTDALQNLRSAILEGENVFAADIAENPDLERYEISISLQDAKEIEDALSTALAVTGIKIDEAARYLRETLQSGKSLKPWSITDKGTKKKWLKLAQGTIKAAIFDTEQSNTDKGPNHVDALIAEVHDAIDEYREGMKGDKFGPHEWPTVDGIKTTVAQSLRRSAISTKVQEVAGWQLVPKQPTEEMLDAYWGQTGESEAMRSRVHARAKIHYHVMLAAAPEKQEE